MEVRKTHVPASDLPSRARDSKVQHPGLQAQNGAISEGNQESTASTADAQAKGLCLQSGGRESEQGAAGLRYDEGAREIRGDGKLTTRNGEG